MATTATPSVQTPPVLTPAKEEREAPKLPDLYAVLLHNDNSSSPLFVVEVLCEVFSLDNRKANDVMMQAHTKGVAVVGYYSKDIAETLLDRAMRKAQTGVNLLNRSAACELTFSVQPEKN